MAHLNDEDLKKLKEGTWEIHCLSMELRRGDGTKVFSGPGHISRNQDGHLEFTIYDSASEGAVKSLFKDMSEPGLRAGELFPQGHYYSLKAMDQSGSTWYCERTGEPSCSHGVSGGAVVRGDMTEIVKTDDLSYVMGRRSKSQKTTRSRLYEKIYLTYYFLSDIGQYPCNACLEKKTAIAGKPAGSSKAWSVARFQGHGFEFSLRKDDGITLFSVQSMKPRKTCPNWLYVRLVEPLRFVLGRPLQWDAVQICHGNREITRVRSRSDLLEARLPPPVRLRAGRYLNEVWELFGRYLRFIYKYKKALWHPVSSRLFTLQHAQASLWNIRMLTAGVEVEGLLNDHYPKKMAAPPEVRQAVRQVCKLIRSSRKSLTKVDDKLLNRITTHLGQLARKTDGAGSRLMALARDNVVRLEDVEAWKQVRHPSAHANRGEIGVTQENVQRLHGVMVLFYHLIFNLIGYKGKYTEYSKLGYPEAMYPPGKVEVE